MVMSYKVICIVCVLCVKFNTRTRAQHAYILTDILREHEVKQKNMACMHAYIPGNESDVQETTTTSTTIT